MSLRIYTKGKIKQSDKFYSPTRLGGITSPESWVALEISSGVASPFLGFLEFKGNKIILLLYSFSLWAFNCRDSTDLFLHKSHFEFFEFFLSVLIQLMYNVRFEPRLIRS